MSAWHHEEKTRLPDIELESIREKIKNKWNVNIVGLNANSPEETQEEEEIEYHEQASQDMENID